MNESLSWKAELSFNAQGTPMSTLSNIALILQNDERLQNIFYNELNRLLDVSGDVPWKRHSGGWSNTDFACFQMYLEQNYQIYAPRKCQDALYAALSCSRRHHPIRDYLDSLVWDGYPRLDSLLLDCFEVEDSRYVRAVTRKTFAAAAARIYQPGIKFDCMLVLCGRQGIGKSTLFSRLGGRWYSDSMTIADMKDKSAAEKLQGIWIMELSELAGIRKVDVETVKSFLSRTDDQYRAPYQSYVEPHPRSSILVGTTNASNGFLRDITGNRRFWPVSVGASPGRMPWELSSPEIDQIWAEAVTCYRQREPLFLPPDLEKEEQRSQQEVLELDPRQGLIGDYLSRDGKDRICLMELWCECLHKDRADFRRADAYELEGILPPLPSPTAYSDGENAFFGISAPPSTTASFTAQRKTDPCRLPDSTWKLSCITRSSCGVCSCARAFGIMKSAASTIFPHRARSTFLFSLNPEKKAIFSGIWTLTLLKRSKPLFTTGSCSTCTGVPALSCWSSLPTSSCRWPTSGFAAESSPQTPALSFFLKLPSGSPHRSADPAACPCCPPGRTIRSWNLLRLSRD